ERRIDRSASDWRKSPQQSRRTPYRHARSYRDWHLSDLPARSILRRDRVRHGTIDRREFDLRLDNLLRIHIPGLRECRALQIERHRYAEIRVRESGVGDR